MFAPLRPVLLFLLLHHLLHAHAWTSSELPNPQQANSICHQSSVKSSICDPDSYLSASDVKTIDGIINFINEGTHDFRKLPCEGQYPAGVQIAIAIFSSMGMGFGSKEARAVQFAKDLHDRWGVGDVTCQNGIVLAIAIEDRAIGISTGAGVKHVLTDDMVRYIISEIRPYMKMKEYGKAIVQAVTIIGNVISGWKPETSKSLHLGSAFFFVVAASSVSFLLISSARSKHRYSKCKRILSSIDEGRKAASRNAYVAKSCPICLEDFSADPSTDSVTQLPSSSLTLHKDADVQTTVPLRTTAGNAQSLFSKTSTASNAAEEEIALPCGHKYHEKCIMSWLSGPGKTNSQCPICRQPVSKDNDDEIENRTNSSQPSGWDVYDPEYSFRMRRTHYYFPDFITWNMINSWHHDRHAESLSMAASHSFSAVDPTVVANAARSAGTGGSSFSFGGGSSAGGGGGGGSW